MVFHILWSFPSIACLAKVSKSGLNSGKSAGLWRMMDAARINMDAVKPQMVNCFLSAASNSKKCTLYLTSNHCRSSNRCVSSWLTQKTSTIFVNYQTQCIFWIFLTYGLSRWISQLFDFWSTGLGYGLQWTWFSFGIFIGVSGNDKLWPHDDYWEQIFRTTFSCTPGNSLRSREALKLLPGVGSIWPLHENVVTD